MDEDKILEQLSLQGEEREKTLEKIHKVVASWGLKLPDVPPDPLHFGFNDFSNIGETEFNVNNNVEQGYCGKFMFMFAGQTCPMHHHRIKHETFFIVKGRVDMELAGKKFIMEQGYRQSLHYRGPGPIGAAVSNPAQSAVALHSHQGQGIRCMHHQTYILRAASSEDWSHHSADTGVCRRRFVRADI